MTDDKRKILDYLQKVTEQTNIKQLLEDLQVNKASFYSGKYSLDRMKDVEKELKKRMKSLL